MRSASAENLPYNQPPSLPFLPSEDPPKFNMERDNWEINFCLYKGIILVERSYSFLVHRLSPPKARKGNSKIITKKVYRGGVKVGVGGGRVAGEGMPELFLLQPHLSQKLRISSLKFETIGPAEC